MAALTAQELVRKKCGPCEGGVPPMNAVEVNEQIQNLPHWTVTPDGQRITRQWRAKNFSAAIEFFNKIAELADEEGHHPDLHLVGYRNVIVELWTHAIGGLSENDFILAAKIDQLPIALKV